MQVSEPGFKGGDRTSLDMPRPEEDLLEAVQAAGKPVVLVLTNGSALDTILTASLTSLFLRFQYELQATRPGHRHTPIVQARRLWISRDIESLTTSHHRCLDRLVHPCDHPMHLHPPFHQQMVELKR